MPAMNSLQPKSGYCVSQKSYNMGIPSGTGAEERFASLFSTNHKNFDDPSARKASLALFPYSGSHVRYSELFEAGLFYTGDEDVTQCYVCNKTFGNWKQGDIPMEVHRRRSPNCSYVNRTTLFYGEQVDNLNRTGRRTVLETDGVDGVREQRTLNSNLRSKTLPEPTADVDSSIAFTQSSQQSARRGRRKAKQTKPQEPKVAASRPQEGRLDVAALRRENKSMRESLTCRECLHEKVQTLFLPCAHLITCESCANAMDDCKLCKKKILGTVRIFLV